MDNVSDTSSPYQLGQNGIFLFSRLWFLIACSMQKRRGKAGSIYKVRVSSSLPSSYRVLSMVQLYAMRVGIKLFHEGDLDSLSFLQKILQCD